MVTRVRVCVTRVHMRARVRTCAEDINKWVRAFVKDLS